MPVAVFAHYCGLDVGFSSANKIGLLSVNKLISDEQLGEERLESGNKLRSRGVQSVEIGLRLLVALAKAGGPMSLRDMSESAGMPPAIGVGMGVVFVLPWSAGGVVVGAAAG